MKKDDIGNRMKNNYENRAKTFLTARTPVIMRLDGKAFHTYTRGFDKPYSDLLKDAMTYTTRVLMNQIQGTRIAYTQSDEISLLLCDYTKFGSQGWFDYNVQKMVSVASAIASTEFTRYIESQLIKTHPEIVGKGVLPPPALFDARVFNIPREEVANYFYWRQIDWKRNSIQMLAQSLFSHGELHKKNTQQMIDMCFEKGSDWHTLEPQWKNGTYLYTPVDKVGMCVDHELFFPEARELIGFYANYTEEN